MKVFLSSLVLMFTFLSLSGQADFSMNPSSGQICAPDLISCVDQSTGASSWNWAVNTNPVQTSVEQNPIFTFDQRGSFTITLSINGGISMVSRDVSVGGGVANIGGSLGSCTLPFTTTLNASPSNFPFGGVANADWVVQTDMGSQSYEDQLGIGPLTYNIPGQYTVSLNAFDSIGCADDTSVTVLVGATAADFTSDRANICPGEVVAFQNLSLGSNLSYSWTFSGGTPSTSIEENPLVTYGSSGIYDVTLTTFSISGGVVCSDSETKTLYITVSGSSYDIIVDENSANCPPLVSNFSLTPNPAPGEIVNIKWYFELSDEIPGFPSDAQLVGSTSGSHIYISGGPDGEGYYDVSVSIEYNAVNCSDSIYKDDFIFVGGQRGALFANKDTANLNEEVTFVIQGLGGTDSILWDFGDGDNLTTTAVVDEVIKQYSTEGVYSPKAFLKVAGCPPIMIFTDDIVVINDTVSTLMINHLEAHLALEIYPNPFSNQTIFKIKGDLDFNYDLVLTDITGRNYRSYLNQLDSEILIEKGNLPKGIYFLNLYESESSTFLVSQKLIVK